MTEGWGRSPFSSAAVLGGRKSATAVDAGAAWNDLRSQDAPRRRLRYQAQPAHASSTTSHGVTDTTRAKADGAAQGSPDDGPIMHDAVAVCSES
ncbi:unnamed protein product [Urochloa humidicola]